MRVLVLGASPPELERLDIGGEYQAISERLDASEHFRLINNLQASSADLVTWLATHRPHIVHLSAHGDEDRPGCTVLCDRSIEAEQFATVLGSFASDLRCVVLNVCRSEAQARAVAEHVSTVIYTRERIADAVAVEFADKFYGFLVAGDTIVRALELTLLDLWMRQLIADREQFQLIGSDDPLAAAVRSGPARTDDLYWVEMLTRMRIPPQDLEQFLRDLERILRQYSEDPELVVTLRSWHRDSGAGDPRLAEQRPSGLQEPWRLEHRALRRSSSAGKLDSSPSESENPHGATAEQGEHRV